VSEGPVNVAFCNDKQYEPGIHVALLTLLERCASGRPVRVFFFHTGFDEADLAKLRATMDSTGHPYELHARACDTKLFRDFPKLHGNLLTYVRLLVAELVEVERILFLDSDVIVAKDVAELFDSDLGGHALGAVASGRVRYTNDQALLKRLGMGEDDRYFNGAVLLMDARRWRERGYSRACLEFTQAHRHERITVDQTALNFVLKDDLCDLPEENNRSFYPTSPALDLAHVRGILHLCGSPKPWDLMGHKLHGSYEAFESLCRRTAVGSLARRRALSQGVVLRSMWLARSYWKNVLARARRRSA
jgi:lipopolysaccharide biosynthesis glycosyltransferase